MKCDAIIEFVSLYKEIEPHYFVLVKSIQAKKGQI